MWFIWVLPSLRKHLLVNSKEYYCLRSSNWYSKWTSLPKLHTINNKCSLRMWIFGMLGLAIILEFQLIMFSDLHKKQFWDSFINKYLHILAPILIIRYIFCLIIIQNYNVNAIQKFFELYFLGEIFRKKILFRDSFLLQWPQ